MSNRDSFVGGFLAGAVVGGVIGGLLGVLLARQTEESAATEEPLLNANRAEAKSIKGTKRRQIKEDTIETARRSLEEKIAQLNETIDDVRLQIGNVNGANQGLESERSLTDET